MVRFLDVLLPRIPQMGITDIFVDGKKALHLGRREIGEFEDGDVGRLLIKDDPHKQSAHIFSLPLRRSEGDWLQRWFIGYADRKRSWISRNKRVEIVYTHQIQEVQ